jgi:palmitoyltransferase ZDHHC9/14/18
MDPSEYLQFSSVSLVEESRGRRSNYLRNSGRGESKCNRVKSKFSFFLNFNYKYKNYGNSIFLFNGRIVIGPKWFNLLLSLLVLILASILIIVNISIPTLSDPSLSPVRFFSLNFLHFLMVECLVLMALTGLSNPGILPRSDTGLPGADGVVDSSTGNLIPRYLLINGVCVRQKVCSTCRIYRPPRSNHCSVCDNCVLRFDHHCGFLGTCVGLGNYRWFLLLSLSLNVFCLISAVFSFQFLQFNFEFIKNNSQLILIFFLSFVGFFSFLLLNVYHLFISCHNITTNEHLKKYYKINPFDYGRGANLTHILCHPQTLLPEEEEDLQIEASYKELGSTNSECVSDLYDY